MTIGDISESVRVNLTTNTNTFKTQKRDNIKFYENEKVFVNGNGKKKIYTIESINNFDYTLDGILSSGIYIISKFSEHRSFAFANFQVNQKLFKLIMKNQ